MSDSRGVNPGPPERALQVGSLQGHKLKCQKPKTGDLMDVAAKMGEAGVTVGQVSPSKGNSHHSAAANRCPGRPWPSVRKSSNFWKEGENTEL